jgi:hypothetical protein
MTNPDPSPDDPPPEKPGPANDNTPQSLTQRARRAFADTREKITTHAGPLSSIFNIPASGALIWTGINAQSPGLIISGGIALATDVVVIGYGSRRKAAPTRRADNQDNATFTRQITRFWDYPHEFASFWGELASYGAMVWGGATADRPSLQALAATGVAQIASIGIIMVPEQENAPTRHTIKIPLAPRFVNNGLTRLFNSRAGKPVADYIVTKPAAASNVLPKITFAFFTAACLREAGWNPLQIGADQALYLACGWPAILLYDLVKKRQAPPSAPQP